ncbi:hypothetical protein SLEP1_g45798 [Rubroshorea leprosula]|uniref:Uncharacterized protein n=1 Tax=Rubroshorea leprosula TaxID=152421 RepID=A0AAV5LMJ2_9ROSI|nr:hypothetical protein SLEP1_g45798 [Rubroshorea leprosula]
MSGVWIVEPNGVYRFVNPQAESNSNGRGGSSIGRPTVLVYLPTGQVISSYSELDQILKALGWERYRGASDLLQYHKRSNDLISLPKDFAMFNSVYMYDIVVKIPNSFHVRDM